VSGYTENANFPAYAYTGKAILPMYAYTGNAVSKLVFTVNSNLYAKSYFCHEPGPQKVENEQNN